MARVAVVQMVSSDNVRANSLSLDALFVSACESGAQLVVLPENFAYMGVHEADKLTIAEEADAGEIQDNVKRLARRYGLWVIAGTTSIKSAMSRVTSSCFVYDDHGVTVERYDKIHLFDVRVSENESHQESATIDKGSRIVVVDTPIGCVGLSVCYDLRFPELYRQLVVKGAEVLSVVAAFTSTTGLAHWDILLRARAIENMCYVLASNQGGLHASGRHTYGHSMIIEPWGSILAEHQQGIGVITADINLERLKQLRMQFPCNDHHVLTTQKV